MVCRTKAGATTFTRAGLREDDSWYLGRGPGRGVWWCREGECGAKLSAANLARALRREVNAGSFHQLERLRAGNSL
ncbi:MAG: DUF448 domain-containing protein [Acidobacteriota bacterium]|nr:DUF448 domain-containing protein [Acidobacteriota bacterium]MDE3044276.1 DUF448 domain-containing protein [Acidobacteriota bacterium]MDE3106848.1 DUF448 domain-containing protein [Acidobacteriota bacterium]MDE3223388.1 DUF448 domain-containing protein [Acidobacteriota bacterium]